MKIKERGVIAISGQELAGGLPNDQLDSKTSLVAADSRFMYARTRTLSTRTALGGENIDAVPRHLVSAHRYFRPAVAWCVSGVVDGKNDRGRISKADLNTVSGPQVMTPDQRG